MEAKQQLFLDVFEVISLHFACQRATPEESQRLIQYYISLRKSCRGILPEKLSLEI
jgi:hypothetical protein